MLKLGINYLLNILLMQTVLGANGQIANELVKELYKNYTQEIKLVSRNPKKINPTDQLFPANLMDAIATEKAIKGSEIVYFTVGLPMNSSLWEKQFPTIMRNVINACKKYNCKLVFFDNTYMYAKNSAPQTENSPFVPIGRKARVRAQVASMLIKEMENKQITAVICRAPEFYGPAKTQSITNTMIFNRIRRSKKPLVPLKDDTTRTLIWTPDASRAMALIGNTPNAFNQTWHLPCDMHPITYRTLIDMASDEFGKKVKYKVIKLWMFKIAALFSKKAKELEELLPRYKYDNIFVSEKFKTRFPKFRVTSYREAIAKIKQES